MVSDSKALNRSESNTAGYDAHLLMTNANRLSVYTNRPDAPDPLPGNKLRSVRVVLSTQIVARSAGHEDAV
jgi:hypothetical protein